MRVTISRKPIKEREFPIRFVKAFCRNVYGKTPCADAWSNWREWAIALTRKSAIADRQPTATTRDRWVQGDVFGALVAIALVRRGDRHRELSSRQIMDRLDEANELILDFIDECDRGFLLGREIPAWLQKQGVEVDIPKLRRKIQGFSVSDHYNKAAVFHRFAA